MFLQEWTGRQQCQLLRKSVRTPIAKSRRWIALQPLTRTAAKAKRRNLRYTRHSLKSVKEYLEPFELLSVKSTEIFLAAQLRFAVDVPACAHCSGTMTTHLIKRLKAWRRKNNLSQRRVTGGTGDWGTD